MNGGVADSAKFYYIVLASCDIGKLMFGDFLSFTIDFGTNFITRGGFYIASRWEVSCRIIHGVYFFWPHVMNWTLFLLNFERLMVVMFPFHAKNWFTIRINRYYIIILIILGIFVSLLASKAYNLVSTPMLGRPECISDTTSVPWWILFRIVISVDMYISPNILSLVVATILLIKIHTELTNRKSLVHSRFHSQNQRSNNELNDKQRTVSLSQISGSLTAIIMAIIHAVFYMPDAIFGIYFYQNLASHSDSPIIPKLWMLYLFTMAYTTIGSITDFWIYIIRIPAFRATLLNGSNSQKTSVSSEL